MAFGQHMIDLMQGYAAVARWAAGPQGFGETVAPKLPALRLPADKTLRLLRNVGQCC